MPVDEYVQQMTREEIISSIREDYSTQYFVSGKGNMDAYAEECVFADPFVSFAGTSRFKQNVSNLGGMMRDIKLDVYDFQEADTEVVTKWRFSCVLDLPWRPLLAAAGSTTHVIDSDVGKVVKHVEAWDVEPNKVIAQLFKPSAKIPTNASEAFFLSASEGDVKGMWFGVSLLTLKLSVPFVVASGLFKLTTGDGLPGESVAWVLLASAAITEVAKFVDGTFGK